MDTCRDRFGVFNSSMFNIYACAMCYHYLIGSEQSEYIVLREEPFLGAMVSTSALHEQARTGLNAASLIYPDLTEPASTDTVCWSLEGNECQRWLNCCNTARKCCQTQLETPLPSPANTNYSTVCPRTWDGFSCVPDTPAGKTAFLQCPSYIDTSSSSELASKFCTANGTWYTDEIKGQEWSNYTSCVSLQNYRQLFHVAVTCHTLSLILTVPAIFILLFFRQLRRQHRVQIHVNLLLSLLLTNVVWVLWEGLVYRDRLENTAENTFMYRDQVGCKILYTLTRYTLSANYFWMFLEGAHLFRLIANAFVVPRTIKGYFVFGWLGPLVFVSIYIGLRIYHGHGRCWVRMLEGYEWWIYTPNLLILLCNVGFLIWIVVSLTLQIQVHPNEPSSYRRALKAMAVLTPLFGLQMLVFIYRPAGAGTAHRIYEISAAVVKSSQGAVVALIFCYLNKEVRTQIRLRVKTVRQNSWWADRWNRTMNTRASRRNSLGVNNRKSDQSFMDLTLRPDAAGQRRSVCLYDAVSQDAPQKQSETCEERLNGTSSKN